MADSRTLDLATRNSLVSFKQSHWNGSGEYKINCKMIGDSVYISFKQLYCKWQQRNGAVARGNIATEKVFLKIRDIKAYLCNAVS